MRRLLWPIMGVALGVGIVTLGACVWTGEWTSAFLTEPDELASTGRNPYFILEPGHTLVLEGVSGRSPPPSSQRCALRRPSWRAVRPLSG